MHPLPTKPAGSGSSPSERGSVLLVVLVVLALLSVLVVTYVERSRLAVIESRNQLTWLQAHSAARSALAFAETLLVKPPALPGACTLTDDWAKTFNGQQVGTAAFSLHIEDESGKISLRGLLLPDGTPDPMRLRMINRLFRELGLDDVVLPANLLTWLRDDKGPHARLQNLQELAQIPGFSAIMVDRLRPHLTVHTEGRVNINTASPPVLLSLSGEITPVLAERLIAARPFAKIYDIRQVDGFTDRLLNPIFSLLAVDSKIFHVSGTGQSQGITVLIHAVMERRGEKLRMMSWSEE